MQLEYIDQNLNRIMQNSDSVLYLRPDNIGNKRALFAMIKVEKGVYEKLQITKEQSKMTFPFEPLYLFYRGPGYLFLKNYIIFNNFLALNSTNLDGFKVENLGEHKIFSVGIFATFIDGSSTFVIRERKNKFEKHGGIQPYINLMRQYKEYEPKYDTYEEIECYCIGDNTFVIPKLQEKLKEQTNVKKISPIK